MYVPYTVLYSSKKSLLPGDCPDRDMVTRRSGDELEAKEDDNDDEVRRGWVVATGRLGGEANPL